MKVLLFGARGYLGQHFLGVYPDASTPSVDIADPNAVGAALDQHQPTVVINAAGKTGVPNVDWCEDHKHETLRSNVTGPLVLLDECTKRGIYWVQLSSGCIYQGDNDGAGYAETDPPNFSGSFYSRTKAWADQMLQDFPVLQLRLRMPFDGSSHPRSLITKLLKAERLHDYQNSLTYLPDFLIAARELIAKRSVGTYNIVNPGASSPYRIMQAYQEVVDPSHTFSLLEPDQLSSVHKAGRSNCILSTNKLEGEGITLQTIDQAINAAMQQLATKSTQLKENTEVST